MRPIEQVFLVVRLRMASPVNLLLKRANSICVDLEMPEYAFAITWLAAIEYCFREGTLGLVLLLVLLVAMDYSIK